MYPNTYIRPSLFSTLKNIGWSNILDGTQKTLGVINQAIPIVYQVKPVVSNVRSMFKIASAINEPIKENNIKKTTSTSSNPVFYI
ncbi:MAG: hypothetical protein IKH54_06920 [Bacilli bacterium]|nr:hypothetical protein [Bacilli bacterium]